MEVLVEEEVEVVVPHPQVPRPPAPQAQARLAPPALENPAAVAAVAAPVAREIQAQPGNYLTILAQAQAKLTPHLQQFLLFHLPFLRRRTLLRWRFHHCLSLWLALSLRHHPLRPPWCGSRHLPRIMALRRL